VIDSKCFGIVTKNTKIIVRDCKMNKMEFISHDSASALYDLRDFTFRIHKIIKLTVGSQQSLSLLLHGHQKQYKKDVIYKIASDLDLDLHLLRPSEIYGKIFRGEEETTSLNSLSKKLKTSKPLICNFSLKSHSQYCLTQ
jgi:hypothetical protein